MSVVVLVGRKNAGKTTAAAALIEDGFVPISFADALKDTLAAVFCWPRDLLQGDTPESREWREQVDPWWAGKLGLPDFTPRYALVNVGTQVFRNHFNSEIWVLNVERRIAKLPRDSDVVLVDGRFPNEIGLARKCGGLVIGIENGPEPDWYSVALRANSGDADAARLMHDVHRVHQSEYAWIGTPLDAVIQNAGSIADLHAKTRDLVHTKDLERQSRRATN